jgi:limonene-1,2-epoxide hydrolase
MERMCSTFSECAITSLEQITELWTKTYNHEGKPDWSHLLPYYDDNIHFRDTVQEIHGIEAFKAMVQRLTKRSQELRMNIINAMMEGKIIFVEWEMVINFRKTKTSVLHGASRLTLNETGKIIDQRDYYDLWGDIFDNIPGFGKLYRKFMRTMFG